MEKEKATIYEYARMCNKHKDCKFCPLSVDVNGMNVGCVGLLQSYPKNANEIILKWREEHPVKTRQDKFLKMFPNARMFDGEFVDICPCYIDERLSNQMNCAGGKCTKCKKGYWLAEVEENDK